MPAKYALAVTHRGLSYFHESLPLRFPTSVGPDDRLIMNIYAYFDESGTHKGSQALSIAGFLGKADEWGAFQFEWEAALQEFGLDFFHMASFESRQKGYEWPNDVRQQRLNRLLGIINQHVLGSVGVVLPLAEYDAIFSEDEPVSPPNVEFIRPGIYAPGASRPGDAPPNTNIKPGDARRKSGGPYGLAFMLVMHSVGELAVRFSGDPYAPFLGHCRRRRTP